jgi:hypothetical protein
LDEWTATPRRGAAASGICEATTMAFVTLNVDASSLRNLAADLARLHARIPIAIAQGLNEGGDKVRTQVRAAMRQQTGLVRLKSVTERSSTIRAFPGKLAYTIVFKGKPTTKPDEFVTRVKKGPGGGVTVRMWGVDHRFPRSFQIAGMSGAAGLRMRLGGPRIPIRGFKGPNLAKEAVKGDVAQTFTREAETLVMPIVEKQIARVIRP